MVLTFRNTNGQSQWAKYTNLIPTPITGLTATSTVAGQIVLTWAGGQGANPVYSLSVYNNTGSAAVAPSAYTISGQSSTGATITFTSNTSNSYTITVTSSVLGGSTSASVTVTTLSPNMSSFTTINSVSAIATPSAFSGLSRTTYGANGFAVAVNMTQTKMLFACPKGLYYSTSAEGGGSWATFTLLTGWNLVSGGTAYNGVCSLTSDGSRGIAAGQYTDVYSINWSGSTPVATTITNYGSTANAPWWWSSCITTDGNIALLNATSQGTNAGIYYCVWNSGTSTYETVSLIKWLNATNINGTHAAIAITPDKTTVISETQWAVSYLTLSWSGNVPTATSNSWTSTGIACDMRSIAFLGGGYSGTPGYLLLLNATGTGNVGGFTASKTAWYAAWNQTTKVATSPVTSAKTLNAVGDGNLSIQTCGTSGNIIYVLENIANSGTVFNISYFSFNVT
jgi:hypothetical protein